MNNFNFYPPNPVSVDPNLIKPGSSFQKEVVKIVGSLVLFCFVYFLLLLTAMAVAGVFIALGIGVLKLSLHVMMILLALSLIGVGVFIIIFLFKFVFSNFKDQKAERVEIFPDQHPRLFEFIQKLTTDTNTPMPKRVFISPGINACVFYDSSILSMILPVRKNLEIGLGLVNSLNLSEFKQVLAHEFGHFSQRSMKFGSYVYTMNHIIYNMLFENQGYVRMLNSLQHIHSIFAITGHLTVWIVKLLQSILQKMYKHLNLSHRRLSREMEFHADAVSVSVTGSAVAISALRRIEFAVVCMEYCTRQVDKLAANKIALRNIYDLQRRTVVFSSKRYKIELEDGLPLLDKQLPGAAKSRIQYSDIWSSHPTDAERIARYEEANVINQPDKRLAWVLFNNQPALEEEVTRHYITITSQTEIESITDSGELENELYDNYKKYSLPDLVAGFYDNRPFPVIDEELQAEPMQGIEKFYNDQRIGQLNRHLQNKRDLELLKAIAEKQVAVEYFKVDEQEYKIDEIQTAIQQLEQEIEDGDKWLEHQDRLAYQLHLSVASNAEQQLAIRNSYNKVLEIQKKDEQIRMVEFVIRRKIEEICSVDNWPLDELINQLSILKNSDNELKVLLKQLIDEAVISKEIDPEFEEEALRYLETNYEYLKDDHYFLVELVATYNMSNCIVVNVDKAVLLTQKEYLEKVCLLYQQ